MQAPALRKLLVGTGAEAKRAPDGLYRRVQASIADVRAPTRMREGMKPKGYAISLFICTYKDAIRFGPSLTA